MITNKDYATKLKRVARTCRTLYVRACFGAPMTRANKNLYEKNAYNAKPERKAKIEAADDETFGFDCSGLVKGILWGWNGDKTASFGGAQYASNGVPDINANTLINVCRDVSTDFDQIEVGEAVWQTGHIGVYVGDGLAVECTPKWDDGVQITACNRTVEGFHRRNWTKHGKLPYVEYIKDFKPGDHVRIIGNVYYNGKPIPQWVRDMVWIVKSVKGYRVVIDRSEDGRNAICSAIHARDLDFA